MNYKPTMITLAEIAALAGVSEVEILKLLPAPHATAAGEPLWLRTEVLDRIAGGLNHVA